MSNTYNRGNTFVKYLNVLLLSGSVPVFPTDYTIPTYSIFFKNGSFAQLVADTPMTQGADNIWYLAYTVSSIADLGTYLIKYKVIIQGVPVELTEDYIIELAGAQELGPGVGQFTITDTVESDSMQDLLGVDVYVFLPSDTTHAIAHATTDSSGQFTVQLDEGTYIVLFNKAGYLSETHGMTVDVLGNHIFVGD